MDGAEAEADADAKAPLRLWAQVEANNARVASIGEKIRLLTLGMKEADFSAGLSEEELAAKQAKVKEERSALLKEYVRLSNFIPDFSGITEAERAAEAERLRQQALQEARRLQLEGDPMYSSKVEALARLGIIDFDPKQEGYYYNRFSSFLDTFDLDKESPVGPMRYTDVVYESKSDYQWRICEAVNILSVKIACSDVGSPIHVYGTVIVRDSIDDFCVYHFRRDSDHCQLINSEDESLILTGPKRGLSLLDDIYVETDLKIKDHLGQDRQLSKGVIYIRGIGRSLNVVETESLSTRLSTVDVTYAVVERAVEATIAVEVLRGFFYGKITAYTSNIPDSLVLYDSKVASTMTGDDFGAIRLMRSVVAVYVMDMLIVDVHTGDGKSRKIRFTPRVNRGDEDQITAGDTVMHVKVVWSVMNP